MSWQVDDFEWSLSDVATPTIIAYRRDVDAFAGWATRAQLSGPAQVTGLLRFLATRRYARRTGARKVAAIRRYFDNCADSVSATWT